MKRKSTWLPSLIGAGLLAGCALAPPNASVMDKRVVPFAKIRDAAHSADGYYVLGRELQRKGKFDDAERAYWLALEMEPTHVDARNGLAAISVNRGDVDMALSILDSLTTAHPDQPHLLANLGYAHYLRGNYFDARVALEQAASLDPSNKRTREKLQLVLRKLGLPETEVPPLAEERELVVERAPASAQSGIIAVGPGVYQLQGAPASMKPVATVVAATSPQVLMPVSAEAERGKPSSQVAELTSPAATVTVQASAISSLKAAKLEIINGNGIPRLARTLRQRVHGSDWQVVRVANHAGFNVPMTRVEYAQGNRESAEYLARELQVAPVYRHNDALGDRIRVVLGHNLRSAESLRQRASGDKLAAAD